MKVATKGLILVSVPLLFEVILIFSMLSLVHQTREASMRAQESRVILNELTRVSKDYVELKDTITKQGADLMLLQSRANNFSNAVTRLRELLRKRPNGETFSTAIQQLSTEVTATTAQIMSFNTPETQIHRVHTLSKLGHILKGHSGVATATGDFLALTNDERLKEDKELEKETRALEAFRFTIQVGIGASFVIATFVARLFLKGINKQLKTVSENVHRFELHQTLLPPLAKGDEIADLDDAMHSMEREIAATEERETQARLFRDSVMRMVTHDLRTPLHNVSAFFEFAELQPRGEEQTEVIDAALNDAMHMSELISDMLALEKLQHKSVAESS